MYKVGKCLLLDLLKQRGISQSDLAVKTGVSRQRINAIAHNREKMPVELAFNISKLLQCHIEDLYTWEANKE
ncbi:helix-turn-helix transcriptional regulator [Kurthia senegalensis]|uniref:helix-turn-helix transcriptional regulator n=1 Tax=Kurthia senegalensis TaxID=1033740 RepID=UPI000289CC59|nr:helix-turn-helix domain-containing protein [Kurthia senegalensis]